MNNVEIRDKISSIVWNINSNYSPSGAEYAIMELIEKVQKEAYQKGFKEAEEKVNIKEIGKVSIGEIHIASDAINFSELTEDEDTETKTLYLAETDALTKAAGIYTDAWHNDTYQINFYGIESKDNFKVIVTATVYDKEFLELRYPDIAGNIIKISEAEEAEVAFNDKELEIIKAEFDKTVAEYKRVDKTDRIKKELEYVNNPNRYIDVYNAYRDKSIAYPLAEYLDIQASQSGFDDYKDMLNEGFSIDYSGDYLKEPEY